MGARHTPRRAGHRPAAGLLLRHTDDEGSWYLLGLRHPRLGGTWSNIGGSLMTGEMPFVGASREFVEELGRPAPLMSIADTVECGTEARPYTMFLVDVDDAFADVVLSWEHTDLAWWHHDDVAGLELHAGFRRGWDTLTGQVSVSPAEAMLELRTLAAEDPEVAHGRADDILLSVAPPDVAAAYAAVVDAAPWWASA